jgi:hypothetical protein
MSPRNPRFEIRRAAAPTRLERGRAAERLMKAADEGARRYHHR